MGVEKIKSAQKNRCRFINKLQFIGQKRAKNFKVLRSFILYKIALFFAAGLL